MACGALRGRSPGVVSHNGWPLSLRGRYLPEHSIGFDIHRDSIPSRCGRRRARADRAARRKRRQERRRAEEADAARAAQAAAAAAARQQALARRQRRERAQRAKKAAARRRRKIRCGGAQRSKWRWVRGAAPPRARQLALPRPSPPPPPSPNAILTVVIRMTCPRRA
jgi:hypothetical protein